jgi:sterol desaturase/sphingolipid hydroxylase (fatty acid hydroxylase superfamily)
MDSLTDWFSQVQGALFESVLQPLLFRVGLGNLLPDGFNATGWLLVGVLQLAVLLAVIGPLEHWRLVQPIVDRAAVRTDVLYTLIHRLGLFRIVMFFTLDALFEQGFGALRVQGWHSFQLDGLWPGVTDLPWVSFLLYLLVMDFLNYWIHRAEHQWHWWWQLHALHHAQTQVTMWTDNRNHLLDDVIRAAIFAVVAQLIGIAPGQFVAIVALTQLSESFQHANLKLWFGPVGERLWISPRFHRLHHSIGIGHESHGKQTLGGHNFGVLLPCWDIMFGTANFELRFDATGVRDQIEQGRDYGRGFWAQQWQGLMRLAGRA